MNSQAILSNNFILLTSTILAHSDSISENFANKLLFLQAYLTYSETSTATTIQVLSPRLSTSTPLILELFNITIRHLAIQHNHPSALTTAPITEQQCNSFNILPSFTFCCTLTLSFTDIMKFDSVVSTEHPPDLTDKSLDISMNVDTNINLNTIASIYVVVNIYTNDIVSISTASTSITSTIATIAIMNPDLKYANQKYSLHKLQELESQMITPTIANLSTHIKTARVSVEIEVNVTDYPDASLNQDTDNDIITLRQYGPTQRIIDTLYLDNTTTTLTSTYPYLHPTNNKTF